MPPFGAMRRFCTALACFRLLFIDRLNRWKERAARSRACSMSFCSALKFVKKTESGTARIMIPLSATKMPRVFPRVVSG